MLSDIIIPDEYQCAYLVKDYGFTDDNDEPYTESPDHCSCDNCFYGRRSAFLAGVAANQAVADEVLAKYRRMRQHVRKDGTAKTGYKSQESAQRNADRINEHQPGNPVGAYPCPICDGWHLGTLRSEPGDAAATQN